MIPLFVVSINLLVDEIKRFAILLLRDEQLPSILSDNVQLIVSQSFLRQDLIVFICQKWLYLQNLFGDMINFKDINNLLNILTIRLHTMNKVKNEILSVNFWRWLVHLFFLLHVDELQNLEYLNIIIFFLTNNEVRKSTWDKRISKLNLFVSNLKHSFKFYVSLQSAWIGIGKNYIG